MFDFTKTILNIIKHYIDRKKLSEFNNDLPPVEVPELEKPDWHQNDPEAPDYIKNKPFYEEIEYIPYIPTQTITLLPMYETSENVQCSVPGVDIPWDWLPYRITFDGVEYETMLTDNADNAWMDITLADDSNVGLRVFADGYIVVYSRNYAGEHTITVEQIKNTVHILDSKYLGFPLFAGTGENAICMNDTNNEASGEMALAEGRETVASGFCAHAEGWGTNSSNISSHAEGWRTTASGNSSHAEGDGTTASGGYSHAEGYYTTASGDYGAHAEGGYTTASGNYSHAEGTGTIAIGRSQNVIGEYNSVNTLDKYRSVVKQTSTTRTFQPSITLYVSTEYIFDSTTSRYTLVTPTTCTGTNLKSTISSMSAKIYLSTSESSDTMYSIVKGSSRPHGNISGNKVYIYSPDIYTSEPVSTFRDKYAHIVGNGTGTADNQRSNAHTIDWEGNAWFAGDIYLGGTGQDDPESVNIRDLIGSGGGSNESVQSDWNQNDPEAPDYVKNRPFYTESEPTFTTILPDTTITPTGTGWNNIVDTYNIHFEVGKEYLVGYGYDTYSCIAYNDDYITCIGNGSLISSDIDGGNNEPFVFATYNDTSNNMMYKFASSGSHKITITLVDYIVHQIDKKYIPTPGLTVTGKYINDDGQIIDNKGAEIFNDYINNIASGTYSHAEGRSTTASGLYGAHAEGYETEASGEYGAHAEGYETIASGYYGNHAEGYATTASGEYGAHAEGYTTEASYSAAHAEGSYTIASGDSAHAEGYETEASGHYGAHAEGEYTIASGDDGAHAEGYETVASGNYGSHAEGYYTVAASQHQHAQGKCNIEDTEGKYAHIVGNGEDSDNRSNAHTVDWQGNAWFAGKVFVGGTGQDDPNAVELGTGNGSGGSSVFTVNITGDEENGYSADKTFDEIVEANSSGKNVVAKWNYDDSDFVLYLNAIFDNESIVFSYYRIIEVGQQEGLNLVIESDESISVEWMHFDMSFDEYGNLKTTDKTLIGAINELNSKFADIESICDEVIALQNSYINGTSGVSE